MGSWKPTFESLREFECPEWLKDAKFGIWSHWGPQSVPMCGDWYARHMYIQGSDQYLYHCRHYGHPSKFGYKDICKLWKAENFDPDYLMDLYVKAGANYFVSQAMHHDNFFNYPSEVQKMNAMNVGPHKNIVGMWKEAADKHNLPFGLTEHLGASFSWWRNNKACDGYGLYKGVPYDASDPAYKDFYHDNITNDGESLFSINHWYTSNEPFRQYWAKAMDELIEKFTPDLLYSDGGLPFTNVQGRWGADGADDTDPNYKYGLEAVAKLYNASEKKYGKSRAVYCQKDRNPAIYKIGVLDIEKSQLTEIEKDVWQTDTCIGNWFYDAKQPYKKPDQIIEMLIDIVSKNGVMLLNILQKPDGTIDDEALFILQELAKWRNVCGEGIFGTRPYSHYGEGEAFVDPTGFNETKTQFTSSDFRFTQKDGNVYAFMMKAPESGVAEIKTVEDKVLGVELLGYGKVPFDVSDGTIKATLPENLPTEYTNCLKLLCK